RGGRRVGRRVPTTAGLAPGARTTANRTVESRRLHPRGDRGPVGLRAAYHRAQGEPHSPALETRAGGPSAMNSERPSAYERLSLESAARVDAVCDGFERAWKATRSGDEEPRVSTYLERFDGPERTVLTGELLALDRACRERYGLAAPLEHPRELGAAAEA